MSDSNICKVKSLSNLPFSFEANIGQKDEQVKFLTRGKGYTAFFTQTEVVFALQHGKIEDSYSKIHKDNLQRKVTEPLDKQSVEYSLIKMKMEGASTYTEVFGENILEGKVNYLKGNDPEKWVTEVPIYEKIRYEEIYPGIDLVYYGNSTHLEHDFIVKPGADTERISLCFEGTDKIELDDDGNLLIQAKKGILKLLKPKTYQEVNGVNQEIESSYVVKEQGKIGFIIGEYDSTAVLKIDPMLVYSTYLGGSNGDFGYGIAVDGSGNAYVTGHTTSNNFPTTSDAYDTALSGEVDAFVTKLNSDGTGLEYSTYLGGSGFDYGFGIAVDGSGNAYVTGYTDSNDFPTTSGAYDTVFSGYDDAYVTKLNSTGTGLEYSTYLGGSGYDVGLGIAVDGSGNAYVTGHTTSNNFPTTSDAYDTALSGEVDAFVTKLNSDGTGLEYSTYLGGSGFDYGYGIAVDGLGNAYVTGYTDSNNFPTTSGAYDTVFSGYDDVFVTKLNSTGTGLEYSTYLGGSGYDEGYGIAVDGSGNAYVTGYTDSNDFPTTSGAYDTVFSGYDDAYVTKLNSTGTGLMYSTYLGGSGYDEGYGIAVDGSGNAYVTGYTTSNDFPTTSSAYDTALSGGYDAFITKLNSTGTGLVYSTYLGGSSDDVGKGITVDGSGNAYVTGATDSNDFPTTSGAYDTALSGGYDAFITKFTLNNPPTVPDYSVTTQAYTPISGAVVGDDPDGDILIYSLLNGASHGTAVVNADGTWTYTPNPGFWGYDAFTVLVNDGNEGTAVSIVTIKVLPPISFKQFCLNENLKIPEAKPDIEQILSVTADIIIKEINVIKTPIATSNEGQILTGAKAIVNGIIRQKIQYVADENTQSVHAAHLEVPFGTFVVLPTGFVMNTPLTVTGYIEDIYTEVLDKRTIFKNVTLMIEATFKI